MLAAADRVILFGSLLRQSSLLRFLPAYFDFSDVIEKGNETKTKEGRMSPKGEKRKKTE